MTKLLKISRHTIGILLEWIMIFVIFFAFAIRTSPVQTYLAEKATDYLSKELNTKVHIDKVDIIFLDRVALQNVLILDQENDTLLFSKNIIATISDLNLKTKKYALNKVEIENAYSHVKRDTTGLFNYKFIQNYFKREKRKESVKLFSIKSIKLSNVHFRYDDDKKEKRKTGVDYWHLDAENIYSEIENLIIEDGIINSTIKSFSLQEKSGFILKNLSAFAKVSKNGIELDHLLIQTDKSNIAASQFDMLSNQYTDFRTFVDSVKFDAVIDTSTIVLTDAAYFGYPLEGMVDTIHVKTMMKSTVSDLQLEHLHIRYKDKTQIRGDFNIDDYRAFTEGEFHEKIDYVFIDLAEIEKLKLPNKASDDYLILDKTIKSLNFFEASNIRLNGGFSKFLVSANNINTSLGTIKIENGILFTETERDSYLFASPTNEPTNLGLNKFNLGYLIDNEDIGNLTGVFNLGGEIFTKQINFTTLSGKIQNLTYLNYPYTNIALNEGTFIDNKFEGEINIQDKNLELAFNGSIETKGEKRMIFRLDIAKSNLDSLHIGRDSSQFKSIIEFDITGTELEEFSGTISLLDLTYQEKDKTIKIPDANLLINRSDSSDHYQLNSSIGDFTIDGKLHLEDFENNINYQLSRIFPTLFKANEYTTNDEHSNHFSFDFNFKNTDDVLAVFYPELRIAPSTDLKGEYFGTQKNFNAHFYSKNITYEGKSFEEITIHQTMDSANVFGEYHVNNFVYNDSLNFEQINFLTFGTKECLSHRIQWGIDSSSLSLIEWNTIVSDWEHMSFNIEPSHFYIMDNRWDIHNEAAIKIQNDTVQVNKFELQRKDEVISLNGMFSNQDKHHLDYRIENFELSEIAFLSSNEYVLDGTFNGWGFIANPINNFQYIGDAKLERLKVNGYNVGDIYLQSEWDRITKSIVANGDLVYLNNQTFDFSGNYYAYKEKENIDFDLNFDYTNMQFVNAFLDPDVISDIRGLLSGKIELTGELRHPKIAGDINLEGGSAFVDLLGVHFAIHGPIEVHQDGFYINSIPVFDEEGNAGSLVGTVFHEGFKDFNFDLQFDIENDAINKDPIIPWKQVKLKEFLVMETSYNPDAMYYGKAYATGTTNISGTVENIDITVSMKSKEGTEISIPMYGYAEIEDETSFITFKNDFTDSVEANIESLFDFTGVNLDLNFDVTEDASVKIIFNDDNGDEIVAKGSGIIAIRLNEIGDVTMDGTYTVHSGVYNFVMGPIKQTFIIEEGGTLTWVGDPLNAKLNVKTYYKVNANIAHLSQDQFGSGNGAHQPILCYLNLQESLLSPAVSFDINAPSADAIERSLISRVKNDNDELNRQFFSLLLWKRFQPLTGLNSSDGSAALDLISNQLNSMLSTVSQNLLLNVQLDSDQLSGNDQYQFGVRKELLDNRLILSGTFGVENYINPELDQNQSEWIGDLYAEYLINKNGTFRVNIFNESTDKTIIEANELGTFTQGVGLSYKEDFNTTKDFKLLQTFLNAFRKKENRRSKSSNNDNLRRVPVD